MRGYKKKGHKIIALVDVFVAQHSSTWHCCGASTPVSIVHSFRDSDAFGGGDLKR